MSEQLSLFDIPDEPPRGRGKRRARAAVDGRRDAAEPAGAAGEVGAAAAGAEYRQLAARLGAGLYLGTSSWSFPGWAGIIYDRSASETRLAREGLAAYARHPLMRAVGIDRTYYAPIRAETFAAYAAAVPAGFRFLVKAHELCTLPMFTAKNRYGRDRGEANELFLEPGYAVEQVIGPAAAGLGEKLGVIVFQFTPLNLRRVGGAEKVLDRLAAFLAALPREHRYAVEIRNTELFNGAYRDALAAAGAAHCFTVHPTMPSISEQAEFVELSSQPALVVRWMLGGGQLYEEARDRYAPFDRLVDEDVQTRSAIAELCGRAVQLGRPAVIIANNKAEGSAPLTIIRLAERIDALTRAAGA